MRRIKMLEYALRVERYVKITTLPASTISDVSLPSKFQAIDPIVLSRCANDEIQRLAWSERREGGKRWELPTKRRSVQLSSVTILIIDFYYLDSALPQERIPGGQPNGNPPSNPSSRPHTWAGVQLTNGPQGMNLITKPPPGRDPKSRARSREYLKQCVQIPSFTTYFLLTSTKVFARGFVLDLPSSNEPSTESTTPEQPLPPSLPSECSVV